MKVTRRFTKAGQDPFSSVEYDRRTSRISNPDGSFQLLIDPGTYRLDFDPPAGAAVPRLTQTGVVVAAGSTTMGSVDLLSGELVNGVFLPQTRNELLRIAKRMANEDRIEALILGGTDLPLLFRGDREIGIPLLDTAAIHVERIVGELLA